MEIRRILRSLFIKGSFIQNIGFTSSSKIIVMSLSFLFVPILSRIYPPEAYGSFALYNSIASTVVAIALIGYPNAYVLIKKENDFISLMSFQLLSIVIISTFLIIPVLCISSYDESTDKKLLWLIPGGVFINGFIVVFANWMIRNKDYKVAAILESSGEIVIRLMNMMIGLIWSGYRYGLIIGNMSGRSLVNTISLIRFFKKDGIKILQSLNPKKVKQVLIEWKEYPKYILPNQLIQQLGNQVPIYFLALVFGDKELGYFSMALTLFSIPVQLFSNAISPVYFQKANELNSESFSSLREFTSKLLLYSQVLIIIPILVLIGFSQDIIPFFLGAKWESTAIVISISALYVFLEILLSPVSSVFQVLRKEKVLVMINVISLATVSVCLAIAAYYKLPFYATIAIFSGARVISEIIRGLSICRILQLSFIKLIGFSYGLLVIVSIITFILRT